MLRALIVSVSLCVHLLHAAPDPANFKVDVLAEGFIDPQEMVMLPDGRILICERTGRLRVLTPGREKLTGGGSLEVAVKQKNTYYRT